MGIFDRIADRLETLARAGDDEAAAVDELALVRGLADRGDLASAELRLEEIAARHPRLGPVHAVRGEILERRGDLGGAAESYGRACNLESDRGEYWEALGRTLAALGRLEPARDALRRALALGIEPSDVPHTRARLGEVYARAGHLGKARRELRRAVDALPDDAATLAALGRVLVAAGEPEGADYLARAARMPGGVPRMLIEAAAAKREHVQAEQLLREAVARAPEDADVRCALAARLVAMGDFAAAVPEARAATALAPDQPATWRALREALSAAGDYRAAIEAARREEASGAPPPFSAWLTMALGSEDAALLDEALAHGAADVAGFAEARAFRDGRLTAEGVATLAAFAPGEPALRAVLRALAPPPPPEHSLFGLLDWARDIAARHAPLAALAVPLARAEEAFDRPLRIAVMGEFNAGKSSFVNALAGLAVAPVGITPTTATINILRHGQGGGRALYHDGTAVELGPQSIGPFLAALKDAEAAHVRQVEIFSPIDVLRRLEIVDTPGLNSLRPEHEKIARDFLREADALVWVFAVGQAAKASEREALELARGAGKPVLGVVNKVDRASPDEIAEVARHVESAVGDLVFRVLPLSARAALGARLAGDADALQASGLPAIEAVLDETFFAHARELKRESALAALRRFTSEAEALAQQEASAFAADLPRWDAIREAVAAVDSRLRAALAAERVALRARLVQATGTAAAEVRELAEPRGWGLGARPPDPTDESFVADVLEDGVLRATDRCRATLIAALIAPDAAPPPHTEELRKAIDAGVERFRAYARGVVEGAAASLFRHELPRLRMEVTAIRNALARFSPDPEEMLFSVVERGLAEADARARRDVTHGKALAQRVWLAHDEHVVRPLAALRGATAALGEEGAPAHPALSQRPNSTARS